MIGQELIIIFVHDKGFLCTEKAMSFDQLDLPPIAHYFRSKALWRFRVLNYIPSEKKIYAEILSYHVGDDFFSQQQLDLSDQLSGIETLVFKSIDTMGLLKTLKSTTPLNITAPRPAPVAYPEPPQFYHQQLPGTPPVKKIEDSFSVPLKEVVFYNGGVSFTRKIGAYQKLAEIHIANEEIREEYDAIKNYFGNILQTKKIQVKVLLEFTGAEITNIVASSPEIAKITRQFIEDIKFEYISQTINRRETPETTQTIFTMEEYFDTFGEENFESKIFCGSEDSFLEDLLKISNTKHYTYLRYLSSKHLHTIMRLRFVHRPFSFIFLLEGLQRYFIIWETLDTAEATYTWSFEKTSADLTSILKEIDAILARIQLHGKKDYLSRADNDFKRIHHDYTDIPEGFSKWKTELNNHLFSNTVRE